MIATTMQPLSFMGTFSPLIYMAMASTLSLQRWFDGVDSDGDGGCLRSTCWAVQICDDEDTVIYSIQWHSMMLVMTLIKTVMVLMASMLT